MRRFTRLTNAFSKKLENLTAAVSLHFMYYNFGRPHQTLTKRSRRPTTPAMAAGVADHVWTLTEIARPARFKLTHYPDICSYTDPFCLLVRTLLLRRTISATWS